MAERRREQQSSGARKRFRAGLFCALTVLCALGLPAQQFRYDHWTAGNSGLPQNDIRGIFQTPDGYLWIATLDGLARFDGVRFSVFNKGNIAQIASDRISTMVQDAGGDLWMMTESGGLTRYSHGAFHTYGPQEGVPANSINGILCDRAGTVWLLSGDSILRWDRRRDEPVDATPNGRSIRYEPLLWGNGLWGRDSSGLHVFSEGHVLNFPEPAWITGSPAFVAMDENGGVWLESLTGKQGVITPGERYATMLDPMKPRRFSWRDAHGRLRTFHVGPRLTRFLDFESSGGTASVPLAHPFEDREGSFWIGSEGSGLYRLQEVTIRPFSKAQGLIDRNVYPIYQDPDTGIWLGAWPSGLSHISGGHISNYTTRDGLPNPLVSALTMDQKGRIWVGTRGGLVVYRNGKFVNPPGIQLPAHAFVQAMIADRGGTLWIGTTNGLVLYRDGPSQTLTSGDGLATDDVRAIVESRNGDIWIAGYGGLTRVHGAQFTRWTERDGLPGDNIRALYEDAKGVLWIGTYDSGLGRLKDGIITRYTERDGLFNHGVFQILEDTRGNLWMSSNRGIYRVKKDDLNAVAAGRRNSITSVAYGTSDGMLNVECNGGMWPAGIRTRAGELWFPTQDGVAIVDPAAVRNNPKPPPVVIETALVDHVAAKFNGPLLRIPPNRENLEIQYTALSFIHSEQIRFRYMLEGLDSTWIDAGSRRTAYYSHLPTGEYVFHVIAHNSDGVWNAQGQSLRIKVLAPFYRTWWFTMLFVMALTALAIMIVRYRLAQMEERQALQKAFSQQLIASQEKERQRIAAGLHDSLGQRLVVINNLALLALREHHKTAGNPPDGEALKEISEEAALAIQETREISYDLRPFQLDRLGLTKALEGLTRSVASASGIKIGVKLDNIDDAFPEKLRINLYRILQESLNNVMKHAHATEVEVRVTRGERGVTLMVRDNGVGFVAANRQARVGKSGFGTTGMTERANSLGGVFNVVSSPGQGTVMTVEIPI